MQSLRCQAAVSACHGFCIRGGLTLAILLFCSLSSINLALAQPVNTNFAAGSLIIPMEECYQNGPGGLPSYCVDGEARNDDGIVKAYGLVWLLLKHNIPVAWIIDPDKTDAAGCPTGDPEGTDGTIDGRDFCIDVAGGEPVRKYDRATKTFTSFYSQSSIAYRGAPFVIPASNASAAMELIQRGTLPEDSTVKFGHEDVATFDSVDIHVAQAPFIAPVDKYTFKAPRLAVYDQNGKGSKVLVDYLNMAGLDFAGAEGTPENPGYVFDIVLNDDINNDVLTTHGYRTLWMPHYLYDSGDAGDVAAFPRIQQYVDAGNGLMAECASIESFEESYDTKGKQKAEGSGIRFMTPSAITINGANKSWGQGNGQGWRYGDVGHPIVQKGDFKMLMTGGHVHNFKPALASAPTSGGVDTSYKAGVVKLVSTHCETSVGNCISSEDDWDVATFRWKNNDPNKGPVVYVGGHHYKGTGHRGAQRIILNTMFHLDVLADTANELTRSSPIVVDGPSENVVIQGTYTVHTVAPSNVFDKTDTSKWQFPASEGQLRIIDQSGLGSSQVKFSEISSVLWNGAESIPDASSRNVYTALPVGGPPTPEQELESGFTLTELRAVNANELESYLGQLSTTDSDTSDSYSNDAVALIEKVRTAGLGGIDRSTPAYIPPSNLVNTNRPAVLYVGALDGGLHAFTVKNVPGNSTDAWTDPSFVELWNFIPPGQLSKLQDNSAGVQASPAVADVFADFNNDGVREWQTILTTPTGDRGTLLYALNISDPESGPGILWAANTASMGGAYGSAIASIQCNRTPKAVVILATNVADPADPGFPGIKVAALDLITGNPVWVFSRKYTKPIPTLTTLPNDIPATVNAIDKFGTTGCPTHVYVGDFEGKIWEIDANTGESTTGPTAPLWDADPAGTEARFPIGASLALYRDLSRKLHVVAATGGTDWAPVTSVQQKVVNIDVTTSPATVVSSFDLALNERVFASPVVSGNEVYILTSLGQQNSINSWASSAGAGSTYRLNLTTGSSLEISSTGMGSSSVGLTSSGSVVTTTNRGMTKSDNPSPGTDSTNLESPYGGQTNKVKLWLPSLR